jgi:CBS domain-containing protein
MNTKVEVIDSEKSVEDAAKMMADGNFGGIPIAKNDKMIGMITDRDIVVRVVAEGKVPNDVKVSEVMSEGISYCFDDEDIETVVRKMGALQHRRMPVVDRNKRLVGVVSLIDIAKKANNEKLTHDTLSNVAH